MVSNSDVAAPLKKTFSSALDMTMVLSTALASTPHHSFAMRDTGTKLLIPDGLVALLLGIPHDMDSRSGRRSAALIALHFWKDAMKTAHGNVSPSPSRLLSRRARSLAAMEQ